MALKTVVTVLDDIGAEYHDLYKETKVGENTVWVLDLEGIDNHPNVKALKNAHDRQKEDRRKAAEDLAALQARVQNLPEDFDPEKYQEMLHELEELRNNPNRKPDEKAAAEMATARKNLEQKIARMEKDHETAIKKKDEEVQKRDLKITALLIDDGLTKALIDAGVSKEYLKATKAMLRDMCSVVEEDGDYHAVVKSDLGEVDIPKFVTDWVAGDEGKVFVAPAKGSDASNNSGRPTPAKTGAKNPWHKDSWNLTEQGKLIKTDRAKAEQFAKAAGKKLPPAAA